MKVSAVVKDELTVELTDNGLVDKSSKEGVVASAKLKELLKVDADSSLDDVFNAGLVDVRVSDVNNGIDDGVVSGDMLDNVSFVFITT